MHYLTRLHVFVLCHKLRFTILYLSSALIRSYISKKNRFGASRQKETDTIVPPPFGV